MRILVVTSDFPPDFGGMAEYSRAWVNELARRGFDVRVLVRRSRIDPTSASVSSSAWQVEDVFHSGGAAFAPLSAYRALAGALKKHRPDLIFAHTWIGWGPALAYLKGRTGIPYIVAAHGAEILGPARSRYYGFLMTQALRGADYIFPVSRYTADLVADHGISRERLITIGNGVDLDRFRPAPKNDVLVERFGLRDKNVIVTVGGLVSRKGHDIVIRAMQKFVELRPHLRYVIVGGWSLNSSQENQLRDLVEQLGLSRRVIFTGYVPDADLPDYYRLGDIFALTGRTIREKGWVEGFGISLLDAAACGLPIITTDTGGTRDAVCDDNALIVPPEDPAATAVAIGKLLDDSSLRNRMSHASVTWAARNTWARKIDGAIEFIKKAGHIGRS